LERAEASNELQEGFPMTTSTYSDMHRLQRRTMPQPQRLALAIALSGMVAVSVAALAHIGPIDGQTSANVSALNQTRAPGFVQMPARPY
jgi:hypothetical protein